MAINLEFIDFIVPMDVIRQKYPGGWAQCLEDHAHLDWQQLQGDGRVWYVEHLWRNGAMNPLDMGALVERWVDMGFEPFGSGGDGKRCWQDMCVVESMRGGPTLPCSWIALSQDGFYAYKKGTEPGPVAGRHPEKSAD